MTNVAERALIIIPDTILLFEFRKCIDHDTSHDALEHDLHEDYVHCVENEPHVVELLHRLPDRPSREQR